MAVLDDKALLPGMHESVACCPPYIENLIRHRMERFAGKDAASIADKKCGCAIADAALKSGARSGQPTVRGDHQCRASGPCRDSVESAA